jgi:hypothetical protein
MALIKISQLPQSANLNPNPFDSYFVTVDSDSLTTTKISAKAVGDTLYANNQLYVGSGGVALTNVIAQFTGSDALYLQTSVQNLDANGSSDYVITADDGTNESYYVDLGYNNSAFSDPDYSAMSAHDAYLFVKGEVDDSFGGNLVVGTSARGANVVFIAGGTLSSNIVGRFHTNSITFLRDLYINGANVITSGLYQFADGTQQQTAAIKSDYITSGFSVANSAYTAANNGLLLANSAYNYANVSVSYINSINVLQNTNIESVNTFTQSSYDSANSGLILADAAFAKANAALANTTGIFDGDLTITGNTNAQAVNTANIFVAGTTTLIGDVLMNANTYMTGAVTVNSTMVLANTTFSASEAAFSITAAGSSQTPTQAGTLMQLTSKADTPARVLIDSFGTSNTAYPIIAGRNARGTVNAPTATQNNDILLRIAGNSYGDTGYAPFGDARIDFVASENHTDTARGSRIRFWNTPNGSNVVNEIASFNADSVYFTGTVAPEKGFIYTPNIESAIVTTVNLDFARDSLRKFTINDNLTITLSNFVYGKVIEVWIVNSAAQNKTVTHGCFANNSTEHSTTFTIVSQSCAYLRYFSIDGDLANTFVSITA